MSLPQITNSQQNRKRHKKNCQKQKERKAALRPDFKYVHYFMPVRCALSNHMLPSEQQVRTEIKSGEPGCTRPSCTVYYNWTILSNFLVKLAANGDDDD